MPPIQTNESAPWSGAQTHVQQSGTLGQILIVDDSRESGMAQAELLRMTGYSVELVADGRAALQAVELHQPDLIILDVRLPGIDGYAVCNQLKRTPATWQIPIIMVTVEGELHARLQGIEAGADDYLQKPADQQELEARIRALLRTKR
ncbi:MAG: response regulator, partial [Chloroflexota bacterium]|nr:response regulator [Chloroflexota bacterium]